MTGTVSILNVGEGDTKLTFDKKNPVERERAAKVVADMLARGYALLVQVGKKNGEPIYQRAHAFDPRKCEYIIAGGPDEEVPIGQAARAATPKRKRGRPPKVRIPADSASVVAVGRTAGG